MAMQIEKTFQVKEPIEKVWSLLSDPRKVATCVPGAKITEQVDEKTYKGAISVKVGPSVTDYKGELQIVRLDAQNHEIEILGKGQDVRGRGSASMKMTGKLRGARGWRHGGHKRFRGKCRGHPGPDGIARDQRSFEHHVCAIHQEFSGTAATTRGCSRG